MKYYKIIQNKKIIGAVNEFNFKYLNPINNIIFPTSISKASFIQYNNILYHDSWMAIVPIEFKYYQQAVVEEIEQQEYEDLITAIENNILIDNSTIIEPLNPIIAKPKEKDTTALDFLKESKIKELSYICNQTIEKGVDVEMLDEQTYHFSLTTQDQLNLISLQSMIDQGLEQIPYHADGELCKFYSPVEIKMIITEATKWKTYHTTYFNALKNYVNSLENVHQIAEIQYGIELPEEYQTDVLKSL